MIFKNNTMTMVTDARLIGNEINNKDFVTVVSVCNTDSLCKHPNVYDASILMPPTEILMAWADGNVLVMNTAYPQYLINNKDADDMVIALLAALTKKNIILYIPNDEFSIFGPQLLQHIYFMYGITMNTPTSRFSFDENKLPMIISKFYMMGLMEPMDYISSYPPAPLPPFVIGKLADELKPFDRPATFQEYVNYFNNLVITSKQIKEVNIATRVDKL